MGDESILILEVKSALPASLTDIQITGGVYVANWLANKVS